MILYYQQRSQSRKSHTELPQIFNGVVGISKLYRNAGFVHINSQNNDYKNKVSHDHSPNLNQSSLEAGGSRCLVRRSAISFLTAINEINWNQFPTWPLVVFIFSPFLLVILQFKSCLELSSIFCLWLLWLRVKMND